MTSKYVLIVFIDLEHKDPHLLVRYIKDNELSEEDHQEIQSSSQKNKITYSIAKRIVTSLIPCGDEEYAECSKKVSRVYFIKLRNDEKLEMYATNYDSYTKFT
jgi:hypothetical protein